MRILHAISNLSPQAGGPPKAGMGMARAMVRRGHDVSIYTTNFNGADDLDVPLGTPVDAGGVMVTYFPVHAPRFWETCFPLGRALQADAGKFDLMHLHSLYMYHDRAGGLAAQRNGIPYIVRPHGTLDPYIWKRRRARKTVFEWWFQNRVLENAAALHYTTEDEWRLAAPVARNPHGFVVPNGLDTDEFATLPAKGAFRAQHPEIGDRPIILFLGRLNFKKGLDLLAPAFGDVLAAGHDAHLVIAGPDDDMADKTRGWLSAAGALDRTTFTGMITGDDKLAALADAAMFVLPSYSENFGIAVAEAMACGLPVVISDAVNIWPDVKAADAGLVGPCDAAVTARHMIEILENTGRAADMGRNGIKLVRDKYSWDGIAPTLEKAYEDVLAGRNSELTWTPE
jgi:glycosyltransferase involved in cell wall biosynthesis